MTSYSKHDLSPNEKRWAICIFASRETLHTLLLTIDAALLATVNSTLIHVIVNGNNGLANELIGSLYTLKQAHTDCRLRVWTIQVGDKANAWNQYFHTIWSGEQLVFFTDGYVRLHPTAINLLGNAVISNNFVLGGSGIPSEGRSAMKQAALMNKYGGFHGNLCCIKGSVIEEFRLRKFFIPLGMYRTDSLIGAVLSFGLDPNNDWRPDRIHIQPDATWSIDPKHWWKLDEIKASIKRRIRQARGLLENQAVKDHFENMKRLPEALPKTSSQLINNWMNRHPFKARILMCRSPLTILVTRALRQPAQYTDTNLTPQLASPHHDEV